MPPDYRFEKRFWKKGYRFVAGVDEVGRGCFAGPVVAGCVVFGKNGVLPLASPKAVPPANKLVAPSLGPPASRHPLHDSININDSKKLTSGARERAYFWIKKNAAFYGIGKASVAQINKFGIKKATEIAFRRAIKSCKRRPDYLLMDAFYVPYTRGLRRRNQLPIVHGDAKSITIAAASIIAKVYRDKLMISLSRKSKYKKYGWEKNKGYGTKKHRKAIKKYGATSQHRKQFVETWLNKNT